MRSIDKKMYIMLCIGVCYTESDYKFDDPKRGHLEGVSCKYHFFMDGFPNAKDVKEHYGVCVAVPPTRKGQKTKQTYSIKKSDLLDSLSVCGYPDLDPAELVGASFNFILDDFGNYIGIRNLSWENK